jgi:hypothetical protein
LIFYQNGKRTTISTKQKLKSDAVKFLKEFKGVDDEPKKMHVPLLSEFEYKYIKDARKTKSKNYLRSIQLSFRMLSNQLGDIPIDKIKFQDVNKFISLTYERSKAASGLYHRTLKAAFSKVICPI